MSLFFAVLFAAAAAAAHAQGGESRCADCHFANFGSGRLAEQARHHLQDWDSSPHGRQDVGCEGCHGGDSTTFDSLRAHRDMLSARNPASPVAPARLPATCGTCHAGPWVAYQESQHYELLLQGDEQVPVCTLCHGAVGAYLPSPRALESRCEHCHGVDGATPMPSATGDARRLLEEVREIRSLLEQVRSLIRRIDPGSRRERLEAALRQAEVPLAEAVASGHAFALDGTRERLERARQQTSSLMRELAGTEG